MLLMRKCVPFVCLRSFQFPLFMTVVIPMLCTTSAKVTLLMVVQVSYCCGPCFMVQNVLTQSFLNSTSKGIQYICFNFTAIKIQFLSFVLSQNQGLHCFHHPSRFCAPKCFGYGPAACPFVHTCCEVLGMLGCYHLSCLVKSSEAILCGLVTSCLQQFIFCSTSCYQSLCLGVLKVYMQLIDFELSSRLCMHLRACAYTHKHTHTYTTSKVCYIKEQ